MIAEYAHNAGHGDIRCRLPLRYSHGATAPECEITMPRKTNTEIKAEIMNELDAKLGTFAEALLAKLAPTAPAPVAPVVDAPVAPPATRGGRGRGRPQATAPVAPPAPVAAPTALRTDILKADVLHGATLSKAEGRRKARYSPAWDVVTKFVIGADATDRHLLRMSPLKPSGQFVDGAWVSEGYVAKADVTLTSTQARTLAAHLLARADAMDNVNG